MSVQQKIRQGQDQRAITRAESLQATKQLVETALGSICYIRGIFPDDHFIDEKLPDGSNNETTSSQDENGGKKKKKKRSGGIKVKKIKKGESAASDTLINYMHGVFDAVQKTYLASAQFVVYLNPSETPLDVIEVYTFDFKYHSDGIEMEVRDGMQNLVLSNYGQGSDQDTPSNSKSPGISISEVKSQVQNLVKRLITAVQTFDNLPRRRYVSFKLSYTDSTPADYEPPHFRAADPETSEITLATSDPESYPLRHQYGALDTGFHGLSLRAVSIAGKLDQMATNPTDSQVKEHHKPSGVKQRQFIWPVEPKFPPPSQFPGAGPLAEQPTSIREEDGMVVPFEDESVPVREQIVFPESAPVTSQSPGSSAQLSAENKQLGKTQVAGGWTQPTQSHPPYASQKQPTNVAGGEAQALTETQLLLDSSSPSTQELAPIVSTEEPTKGSCSTKKVRPPPPHSRADKPHPDKNECHCGDPADDDGMVGCDKCDTWSHQVCYGYLSAPSDQEEFICFKCRVASLEESSIAQNEQEMEAALGELKMLALFRRALAHIYGNGLVDSRELSERVAVDLQTAVMILGRLKQEQYIIQDPGPKTKGRKPKTFKPLMAVNENPDQLRIRNEIYFSPGYGSEAQCFGCITTLSDTDADYENDSEQLVATQNSIKRISQKSPEMFKTPARRAHAAPSMSSDVFWNPENSITVGSPRQSVVKGKDIVFRCSPKRHDKDRAPKLYSPSSGHSQEPSIINAAESVDPEQTQEDSQMTSPEERVFGQDTPSDEASKGKRTLETTGFEQLNLHDSKRRRTKVSFAQRGVEC